MTTTALAMRTDGLHVVTAEMRVGEPPDLWTSRAPASMASTLPVQRTLDGVKYWCVGDKIWSQANVPWLPVSRKLALLDSSGIWAQSLYPGARGFGLGSVAALGDPAICTLVARIYNEFLAEMQADSGGRLLPQAILPTWDIAATVKEMTRLLYAGIRGFTLPGKPDSLGAGQLFDRRFEPMWDLFDNSGAVANFHVSVDELRDPASNVRVIANLCLSNLFERYPRLRIVSTGRGLGGGASLLEALEYLFRDRSPRQRGEATLRGAPGDYLRQHVYVISPAEQNSLRKLVAAVGSRNVLVESGRESGGVGLAHVVAAEAPQVVRDVLQDNPARLYRLLPSAGLVDHGSCSDRAARSRGDYDLPGSSVASK